MKNIKLNKKGNIKFNHSCIMCMRCSLYCPKDAVRVGILDAWGWRVNGPYNFEKINRMPVKKIITDDTEGFFKCYAETYSTIRARHKELFGEQK